MEKLEIIGVVGAGQMGSGIAQLAAVNGFHVWILDSDSKALERAINNITNSIKRLISKGKLPQDTINDVPKRLHCTTNLEDFHSADFVIEAIAESEAVKKELFTNLDKITKPSAILASNTSSISITRLASVTSRPKQVIGMHFMNPPPIMTLVEIIRGADTSDETFSVTKTLAERYRVAIFQLEYMTGFFPLGEIVL